ncbi:MAG: tetratricopeptide repeat protein [Thermoguttaceae bacterium]
MLEIVYSHMVSGDSFQAADFVESHGTPLEIANTYSVLVQDLYSKKRDLPRMILLGRAGIHYCLSQATRPGGQKPAQTDQLRGIAKTIAYNLSANAWPGWNEPGIEVSHSDTVAAFDVARLNLRLAGELKRDGEGLGNAHWLLGAQHLALKQHAAAIEQFSKAVEQFQRARKPDFEQMARGYIGIATLASDRTSGAGRKQLSDAIASLKDLGTDDAKFFAEQLDSVARYFTK